ncbi:hypothetical protein AAEO56_13825 [Flavobacterium sp. DGU11]|uniref:Uncharacterized protein n=1 Tax=Flavobacterium arundinis TaxID=3139143 RepID=A0ABU9HZN1_9FLAO
MPAQIHYKGELYFSSYSELEEVAMLIDSKIPQTEQYIVDRDKLKLTVAIEQPYSKRTALEKMWDKAVTFAISGMVHTFHDENLQDVICANRSADFNAKRPAILIFTVHEFEQTFGKLEKDISKIVYDSPFYIYDISLKKRAPKFKDELPINDKNTRVGFQILDKVWLEHISKSETFLYSTLFKQDDEDEDDYSIQATHGFAPGYTMDTAIAEAKKSKFLVFRWNEYWAR